MEGHRSPNCGPEFSCTNANSRQVTRRRPARSSLSDRSMIVAIDRVDKNCLPVGDIAVRKHLSPQWWPSTRWKRIVSVGRPMMRLRPLLLVLGALILVSGTARAVDHGQFENMSRTTSAPGSKACAARVAFAAAIFPTGIARSTTCEREPIGFQSTVCGGRCRKRRSFETPETRLAKPLFGMSVFAAISKSAVSSRPMPRERCADTFCQRRRS